MLPPEKTNNRSENKVAPPPPPPPAVEGTGSKSGTGGFDPRGKRLFIEVGLVLGVVIGLGILLMMGGGILAALVVDWVPVGFDENLGKAAQEQQSLTSEVCSNPEAQKYVEELAAPLLEAAGETPFSFEFRVADSSEINAFALPGGFVTVNYGLLEAAESGEEIAGVVSHEIQHALLRHGTRRMLRSLGGRALLAIFFGGTDFDSYSQLAASLTSLSYDREQESEADNRGVALLVAANIDPSGLSTFFKRLSNNSLQPPTILSTHPDPGDRAKLVKKYNAGSDFRVLPSPSHISCHEEDWGDD